ncbi:putative expressed protein [Lyophyllum shimeji]|uniref:Expressed protein n=1 Tax=Lyophyllum shimeji TaxID=47721 RepID=A0A9P3UWQ8_LYOSH|nr:putative expressed protein [Lyophyllum shimeji]
MTEYCDHDLDWVMSGLGQGVDVEYFSTFVTEPLQAFDVTPAPPQSLSPSSDSVIAVSTAFYPGSHSLGFNLAFFTSDSVLFYVHSNILRAKSKDAFHGILPSPSWTSGTSDTLVISIPESSVVLDVILYILYDMPCADHAPALPTVVAAIDRMSIYSICPRDHITPSHPSYAYILSFAPRAPLDVYALAAHHDLQELARAASSHLLSYSLTAIDDAAAERISGVYVSRLVRLHLTRLATLKELLLAPPHPHPPTKNCDFEQQKPLARAWALGAAYLAWEANPDLSNASIQRVFRPLKDQMTCALCQDALVTRLKDVVDRWACVDVSPPLTFSRRICLSFLVFYFPIVLPYRTSHAF